MLATILWYLVASQNSEVVDDSSKKTVCASQYENKSGGLRCCCFCFIFVKQYSKKESQTSDFG